jgi:hypothetical protein
VEIPEKIVKTFKSGTPVSEINDVLKEVVQLNEKIADYKTSFHVMVAHTDRHFCVVVPEEFAHELNLKYEVRYLTDNPDLFYLGKARRLGVRPGKKHHTSKEGDFRLMQFLSFPPERVPYFGRTPAKLWIKHNGDCELEVSPERKPQRVIKADRRRKGGTRTKNDDPIPMGEMPPIEEAIVELASRTGNEKTPLRKHLDSKTKVLPGGETGSWEKIKSTDTPRKDSIFIAPNPLTTDFIRSCVSTLNRFLHENPNAVATLAGGHPGGPPKKLKIQITETLE